MYGRARRGSSIRVLLVPLVLLGLAGPAAAATPPAATPAASTPPASTAPPSTQSATTPTASTCPALSPLPDSLQVAWLSPAAKRVGAHTPLTVVRSSALQQLVKDRKADATAVLRALGLLRPRQALKDTWKVTLFDVPRSSLCRPVGEEVPDSALAGVPRCEDGPRRREVVRKGWTDCGHVNDVVSGARTLDVFRVEWEAAASQGFCLLPLPRFLAGRPS